MDSLYDHYTIGLISNSGVTPGRNLRQVLDNHGILQYFHCTVFSDEVGYHKPHPIIFQKAIDELQIEANDIVHVGDLFEADVAGAKASGMKAVWFNATERNHQIDEIGLVPDYEIKALTQLLEILKARAQL